jgi:tetratricopeptide (TPR) repeat protein
LSKDMADHRKSFRPRRLLFDVRRLSHGRLIGAALALVGMLAATPAFAQSLGLKSGEDSLEAGKYEIAARQLSAAVNDKDSTVDQAAKALYLRGIAYRKLGQPARAISDLGAAVWLGLDSSDKARALVNQGLAYKAVGMSSQAESALDQARRASSAGEVDRLIAKDGATAVANAGSVDDVATGGSVWDRLVPSFGSSTSETPPPTPAAETASESPAEAEPTQTAAAPSTGWNAEVSDASTESSSSTVGRWFGSLTGDSAPAPAPAATNPIPAPATTTATRTSPPPKPAPAAPPSAASWAANTETQSAAEEDGTALGRWFSRQTSSAPAPAASTTQAASQGAGYTVQLANSRSKAEAEALWTKAKGTNAQVAQASSRIEKVDIGSFGTFYSVKIGPFASETEGSKVCNALKRGGTDCSVVSPDGP